MSWTTRERRAKSGLTAPLLLIILALAAPAEATHETRPGKIFAILVAVTNYSDKLEIKAPYSLKKSLPVMKDALTTLASRSGRSIQFCTLTDDSAYVRNKDEFCIINTSPLVTKKSIRCPPSCPLPQQGWPSLVDTDSVLKSIRHQANSPEDTVVFYFIGHGKNQDGKIQLQLAPYKGDAETTPVALDLEHILKRLGDPAYNEEVPLIAENRIVILDMCQTSVEGLGGSVTHYEDVASKAGTLVLIASTRGVTTAIAPDHGTGYFTMALAAGIEGEAFPEDRIHKQTSVSGEEIKTYLEKELPRLTKMLGGTESQSRIHIMPPSDTTKSRLHLFPDIPSQTIRLAALPFRGKIVGANEDQTAIEVQLEALQKDIIEELNRELRGGNAEVDSQEWDGGTTSDQQTIQWYDSAESALAKCSSRENDQAVPLEVTSVLQRMKRSHLGILILSNLTPLRATTSDSTKPTAAIYRSCVLSTRANKYWKLPEQILDLELQAKTSEMDDGGKNTSSDPIPDPIIAMKTIVQDALNSLTKEKILSPPRYIMSRFTLLRNARGPQGKKNGQTLCTNFSDFFDQEILLVGAAMAEFQFLKTSNLQRSILCNSAPEDIPTLITGLRDTTAKGIIVDATLDISKDGLKADVRVSSLNGTGTPDSSIRFDVPLKGLLYSYTPVGSQNFDLPKKTVLSEATAYELEGKHLARHLIHKMEAQRGSWADLGK